MDKHIVLIVSILLPQPSRQFRPSKSSQGQQSISSNKSHQNSKVHHQGNKRRKPQREAMHEDLCRQEALFSQTHTSCYSHGHKGALAVLFTLSEGCATFFLFFFKVVQKMNKKTHKKSRLSGDPAADIMQEQLHFLLHQPLYCFCCLWWSCACPFHYRKLPSLVWRTKDCRRDGDSRSDTLLKPWTCLSRRKKFK